MSFRVLQFNMQFGQMWNEADPDRAPIRLEATMAEIRAQKADIIMLQEVEHAEPGGTQTPMPPNYSRLKAEFPDYDSIFAFPPADPRELPFGIGQAIFCRCPLQDKSFLYLPSPPVEFEFFGEKKTPTDRLLLGAVTQFEGREIRLLNAHLLAFFMLNANAERHQRQRELVVSELGQSQLPTILAGDFNVSDHESLTRQFGAAGYRTVQTAVPTWRRRPYVLDHIFHNASLRLLQQEVRPTPVSDHHLVIAEFEFAS